VDQTRKSGGIEKRRSARVAASLPVRWLKAGAAVELEATDINSNGLFLRTDIVPNERALMQLEVVLPGRKIRFFGVARFVGVADSGRGIGVEIHLIDEQDRTIWQQLYRALLLRASKAPSPGTAGASIR
jgi:hypothetical protein